MLTGRNPTIDIMLMQANTKMNTTYTLVTLYYCVFTTVNELRMSTYQ